MRRYTIEVSKTAEEDFENIILYIRNELAGDIVADKYKINRIYKYKKSKCKKLCYILCNK